MVAHQTCFHHMEFFVAPHLFRYSTNVIALRVPEETSETAHRYVLIDRYSGHVLYELDFRPDSAGYSAVRLNRSMHTGDIL